MSQQLRIYKEATVVITGGASGIGRAMAKEVAKRGGYVILADLQLELAQEVAEAIRQAGGKADAAQLDVTDFAAVERLLQETHARTGRLDYMFNNAGIAVISNASLHRIEDWNRTIAVNLQGVVNGVQAAYQIMLKQGFGHIINTASFAGVVPAPNLVAYAATKHAVVGLSKSLRIEAAPLGVRVSVLCPGFIRTPILEGGKYGKLVEMDRKQMDQMWRWVKPMSPQVFAVKAIDAIAKNKPIIVLPGWYKLLWWFDRISPTLLMFIAQKPYQRVRKQLKG